MKNVIGLGSVVTIVIGFVIAGAHATGVAPSAPAPARAAATPAPAAPAAKGPFQRDLLGVMGYAAKHVVELLDAMPQNKLTWRPGPGVRSVGEVYLHMAFANYGLLKAATGKEPQGVALENPQRWEKQTTDKAEIKKILEKSFAFVEQTVGAIPDAELDKKVAFFGHEVTVRSVLIILDGHINEHLGQAVAYARMNKITPPWSKDDKMPASAK